MGSQFKFIITGCAGFIGSTLTDDLLKKGHIVIGIDNFSTGKHIFLENALNQKNFEFIEDDIKNIDNHRSHLKGAHLVFHMAANADVRFGLDHPSKDLYENTVNTMKLLEVMRSVYIKNIIFASTGSVYGETAEIPTSETCPFPTQTSLYGASKLAAESFISAFCEGFNFNAAACRFVSLMGPRYTHGHVFDFVKSLSLNKNELEILGDGRQFKSYFHVNDCIKAMVNFSEKILNNKLRGFNVINLGTNEGISVKDSVKIICNTLNLDPKLIFKGGRQGWVGDNPIIELDISKAAKLGWTPQYKIEESIKETTIWVNNYLNQNIA